MAKATRNIFNKNTHPFCHSGYQYAIDVVEGKIVANIYVKAVCKRMLGEIADQEHEDWFFDVERAERYLRLVQKFKHVKGTWDNPLIVFKPWQNFAWMCIQGFINRYTNFRRFRVVHLDVARGNAKALCLDTDVPTPDRGMVKFGSLQVGDLLYASDGSICRVTNRNETHLPKSYRVTFSDKTTVDCSDQHLWITSNKKERESDASSVKTTEQIFKSLKVGKENNHSVANCAAVEGLEDTAYLPYFLGYWLGNGHSAGSRITCHEDHYHEILLRLKANKLTVEEQSRKGRAVCFTVPHMSHWLKELGVLKNKHIPEKYFLADEHCRRELLRGLMDSDGTISKQIGNFTFCSSKKYFSLQVRRLIASLGYKVTFRETKTKAQNGFEGVAYYLTFSTPNTRPAIFGIRAKEDKRTNRPSYYAGKRYITNVERIKNKKMFCISVDSSDNSFLITDQYIPTHNSTMASQCILFDLALDNPNGNAIKTAATKTSQAELVLEDAMEMARKNKGFLLKTGVQIRASDIIHKESNSSAEALSSKALTNDGLNASLVVMDELHAMKRDFYDVISSGMIKRRDSLMLCITTAGVDATSVGYEQNAFAKKHCLGEITDDTFFALVYTLDKEDNIFDEDVWIKANPGLDDSVDLSQIRAKAAKALEIPSELVNFRIKNMNLWTEDAEAFFSVEQWDACEDKSLTWEDFKGRPCMLAIDLAARIDLTVRAFIAREEGIYKIWVKCFIPEDTIKSKDGVDRFIGWAEEGHIIATPGAVIDFKTFKEEMLEECDEVKVIKMAYDPWNATEFAQSVSNMIDTVMFKQSTANFSEPMKKLDALLYDRKIVHNGNPAVRWCLSNVVTKEDANGNVFPRKAHVKFKIDPIVAIIMGIALWIQEQEEESMYESVGIRSF